MIWHTKYKRTIVKRDKLRCDGCILIELINCETMAWGLYEEMDEIM